MSIVFRPYQERGVAEIRTARAAGARRVLFVLLTGGGKITVFSYITSAAAVGDAVEHYGRLCRGVPAGAFCAGIAHSRAVAKRLNAAGFRAQHVDGETDQDLHRRLIAALDSGYLDVLTNAGLISEWVDVPAVGCAILLRPTESLSLYLQQVGRALRPAPGRGQAIILDHAGTSLAHGLPDEVRAWSLDDKTRHEREGVPASPRVCPKCRTVNRPGVTTCKACGAALAPTPEGQRDIDAELQAITQVETSRRIRAMRYGEAVEWADTEDNLRQVTKARGFHHGWVGHSLWKIGAAFR